MMATATITTAIITDIVTTAAHATDITDIEGMGIGIIEGTAIVAGRVSMCERRVSTLTLAAAE